MAKDKGKKGEEIEFTEEDEAASDRAWDRIAAEDKAAKDKKSTQKGK